MPDRPSSAPRRAPAIGVARRALTYPPAGVVSDVDGTLSPIVSDPSAAFAVHGVREALETLAERLAVVAVVTGRAAADARRIVGTDRVLVVGNHGLEWLAPGAAAPEPAPAAESLADALHELLERVPRGDGIVVEDKRLSATVHYRKASDPGAAREAIVAALSPRLPPGLVLRHGRMSVELRPRVGDKGSAVRMLVERHALRGLLVLGDDVTDLDMFRAAAQLAAEGRLTTARVAVAAGGEAPPEVIAEADAVVPSPEAAADLLRALADA
jgi:trehalose 6-phosphate phosphatase